MGCNSATFFGAANMTSHKKNEERKEKRKAEPKQKVPFLRSDKTGGFVFKNKVRISKGNFFFIVGLITVSVVFLLDVYF